MRQTKRGDQSIHSARDSLPPQSFRSKQPKVQGARNVARAKRPQEKALESCGQHERKKKAPGKELSQGGRGQLPLPGAIGRLAAEGFVGRQLWAALAALGCSLLGAALTRISEACCLHPCRQGAPWSAEAASQRQATSRCEPIHVDHTLARKSAAHRGNLK